MSKRVAIMISGGGSNMAALLADMKVSHPGHPVLVLSNRPDAKGLAKASELGVATAVVDHCEFGSDRAAFDAALAARLDAAQPDIICMAGFMRILTTDFVHRFQGRMINIHPSLLPKYKGLNTHKRALEAGDTQHGCSVHMVTPDLDGGPVLGQASVPIKPGDTPDILAARVLKREHVLYPAVLRRFALGEMAPVTLS